MLEKIIAWLIRINMKPKVMAKCKKEDMRKLSTDWKDIVASVGNGNPERINRITGRAILLTDKEVNEIYASKSDNTGA